MASRECSVAQKQQPPPCAHPSQHSHGQRAPGRGRATGGGELAEGQGTATCISAFRTQHLPLLPMARQDLPARGLARCIPALPWTCLWLVSAAWARRVPPNEGPEPRAAPRAPNPQPWEPTQQQLSGARGRNSSKSSSEHPRHGPRAEMPPWSRSEEAAGCPPLSLPRISGSAQRFSFLSRFSRWRCL